jgi:hypothetical protein
MKLIQPDNMELTAEQIKDNWDIFIKNINTWIGDGDRKQALFDFYDQYQERLILMPAAHKKNTIMHFQEVILNTLIE